MSWYRGAANFIALGRLTHSWKPWNSPPEATRCSGGVSMCRMPAPGRHPLGVAAADQAAAAVRIVVLHLAVDHVGDGLEAAVRMPRGALGLAGRVVDLAHLVQVQERVQGGQVDAGERAANREPLALEAVGGGGDAAYRPGQRQCRVRARDRGRVSTLKR